MRCGLNDTRCADARLEQRNGIVRAVQGILNKKVITLASINCAVPLYAGEGSHWVRRI